MIISEVICLEIVVALSRDCILTFNFVNGVSVSNTQLLAEIETSFCSEQQCFPSLKTLCVSEFPRLKRITPIRHGKK